MRVFVWGAGRCGRTLAAALQASGHELVGTWNRTAAGAGRAGPLPWPAFHGERPDAVDDAEVVWITVPDAAIPDAAFCAARPHHVALHASGALPARVLREAGASPRSAAACHPIQSFAAALSPPGHFSGVTFGIQGEEEACRVAATLARDLGASSFEVADEGSKALYHAGCCVASNALVALADRAVTLFEAAGLGREEALAALTPLILGTAANLSRARRPADALTGPIARGDEGVVAAHVRAIVERAPLELDGYVRALAEVRRVLR